MIKIKKSSNSFKCFRTKELTLRQKEPRLNTKGTYIFTNGVAGAVFYNI